MSEKRFTFDYEVEFEIFDRVTKKHYDGRVGCQEKICNLLNKLYEENEQLRQQLKEKQEDEKEYAREILRLNKLVKEYSEIRQLGGDY